MRTRRLAIGALWLGLLVLARAAPGQLAPVPRDRSVVPYVLRFQGSATNQGPHVDHGYFWSQPAGQNVSTGWSWFAWVKPLAGGGYIVADGYGGNHALLWGFGGSPGAMTGNVYNGTSSVSFNSCASLISGRWYWLACFWDGSAVYYYVDGVCDGKIAFAGPRRAPGVGAGGSRCLVGGSDHSNASMDLAALWAWDTACLLPAGFICPAVLPDRFPRLFDPTAGFANFAADYTVPGAVVRDLSPVGYNASPPPTVAAPAAPTLGTAVSGSLGATTCFVKVTYVTPFGETTPSTESSQAVAANSVLTVSSPPAAAGATGWNVYVSTTTNTETLQATVPMATNWQEPNGGLVSGAALPAANTSANAPGPRHDGIVSNDGTVLNTMGGIRVVDTRNGSSPPPYWVPDPRCPYQQPWSKNLSFVDIAHTPASAPGGSKIWDDFHRSESTYVNTNTPTMGQTEGGSLGPLTWQYGSANSWGIFDHSCVPLLYNASIAVVQNNSADMDVRVTCRRTASNVGETGLCFREQDTSNYWMAYSSPGTGGDTVRLDKVIAGVRTQVAAVGGQGTAWNTLRVVTLGNQITVYRDATQVTTQTDSALNTATGVGVCVPTAAASTWGSSAWRFDNFQVF